MAVLGMAALLLGAAWIAGVRGRNILVGATVLWLAIIALHLVAPDSVAARWIGGDSKVWAVTGVVAGLIIGYRAVLSALSRRARPAETRASAALPAAAKPDAPGDEELERYARHIVLREIGGPGQMRLRATNVLIVGAGGLGAPVCLYLAGAGIGRITLADDDTVSLSNLQRQVLFRTMDQGRPKAEAGAAAMAALNPHVAVTALKRRVAEGDHDLIAGHDLVIDGSDSFASRAAVNRACVAAGVPLLAGAIAQWEGQVTLYDPAGGGPCLTCLFPTAPAPGLAPACAEAGVVGPLPGVVGSLLALESIKHLTGAGQGLRGRMMLFDGLYGENRIITTTARADCPVCQGRGAGPQA